MNIFWDLEHNTEYFINSKMEILFKAAYQKSETLSVISPLLQVTHHFLSSAAF